MAKRSGDVFGMRYGEVLLLRVGASGPEATVYNSFPLNDCPAERWNKLDAEAIAKENGAAAALLNGPRYWLMSAIEKVSDHQQKTKTFGGIAMIEQATVKLSSQKRSSLQRQPGGPSHSVQLRRRATGVRTRRP
jgi:hypothetical protein